MAKILVIIPTYNEQATIIDLVDHLFCLALDLDVLVVDDGNDRAAELITQRQAVQPRLYLIKRQIKSGRGTAVLEGLQFGLARDYQLLVEMDADFSHPPEQLPALIALAGPNRVVIASRYVKGSQIKNWPLSRRIFSRLANRYANFILGIGIHDYTTGYRVYGRQAIEQLDFGKIKSVGYIVLSEIAYQLFQQGAEFLEQKTVFVNRSRGSSNFSFKEIKEAFLSVVRIKKQNS